MELARQKGPGVVFGPRWCPMAARFTEDNARDAAALRGSLDTVGWVAQVMVNRVTGHVVDGHALTPNLAVDQTRGPLAGRVAGEFQNSYANFIALNLNWKF